MSVFLRVDINLIAAVVLGVVVYIAQRRLDKQDLINRSFILVSKTVFFLLLVEAATCIINRAPHIWLIPIAIIMHICLFVTAPILSYYWYYLTKNIVACSKTSNFQEFLLLTPLLLNTLLSLFSPVFNLVFYISSTNVYHRGPFFPLSMAIIYFYLLLAVIHVIKNKRKLERKEFIPIAIFSFFPMAGGLVQGFFYGTLLMWSGSAFALILIYIFLQERMIHVDHSTGVWNNRSFYYYLNRLVKQGGIDKIGVIYIDLECPDEIAGERDRKERENALQAFAEEIKSAVRKGDVTGRLGENKFGIIISCEDEPAEFMKRMIERIKNSLSGYSSSQIKSYSLSFSLYSDIVSRECGKDKSHL